MNSRDWLKNYQIRPSAHRPQARVHVQTDVQVDDLSRVRCEGGIVVDGRCEHVKGEEEALTLSSESKYKTIVRMKILVVQKRLVVFDFAANSNKTISPTWDTYQFDRTR